MQCAMNKPRIYACRHESGNSDGLTPAGVDAVIFDWDGVLVDSTRNYYRAYELVLQELGIRTTPREIYLREGQPTPQLITSLCAERGIPITPTRVQELVQRRREHDVALGPRTFYPGVWDLLHGLRKSGRKLALVTGSSRQSVQRALAPEQERFFDAVVTADDVSRPKPHPEPFGRAAEIIGVPPERCIVVENAPFGVRSARAAGCRVVAICTTLGPEELADADWVVKDHQELEALLATSVPE
jgi:beta-phosphoglucomutase